MVYTVPDAAPSEASEAAALSCPAPVSLTAAESAWESPADEESAVPQPHPARRDAPMAHDKNNAKPFFIDILLSLK